MPTAYCLIREGPHYRREMFHAGLKRVGFVVSTTEPARFAADDILIIWNRYHQTHAAAMRAEQAGAKVVVAENGFFARPYFGGSHFALALDGHNGAGRWPEGDGSRWAALGIELKQWRTSGRHVLLCPNRSFGTPGYVQPTTWSVDTAAQLRQITRREIRHRPHPGNDEPRIPLSEDLADAWAVVVWRSSAGVHALVAGVPTICMGPAWIAKAASGEQLEQIECPPMPERLPVFERLAWAQWTGDEIATGEPFARLLALPASP